MGVMFCGDVLRAVCYAHSAPLLLRGKLKIFLVTEGFFAAASIGAAVPMIQRFGLIGVGYAYVLVQVPYLFVVRYGLEKGCEVRTSGRKAALTLGITALALLFEQVTERLPFLRWVAMPITLVWLWKTGVLTPVLSRFLPFLKRAKS